ncbi:IclR family transcriptional regulator domain-containing protein [Nocardia terpenica]|uniref:IclR-ED domain-containing protein n=1 Tax=Nocardia terpenica TaxID=455432 RepID=A0A161XKK6_9NOCA|nr:IclR family transcriptional regulator C-terminal domain-containing protein [Nocardia terpenica]KZM74398.1 hypothetical protein AWN90_25305 [Nocardia terpenica]NQE93003.1 hypothetical protein [Nocardia terpenica]
MPVPTAIPAGREQAPPALALERVLERIAEVREIGYATADEEFETGLVGVSAPVYGFRDGVLAAINVSAPKQRLGNRLRVAGEFTRTVADQRSAALDAARGRR